MNKTNLIDIVAEKGKIKKKDAEIVVDAIFDAMSEELVSGGKIQIASFGNFKIKERKERVGRNPKTLEEITIPASKTPVFTAGKTLKDRLN